MLDMQVVEIVHRYDVDCIPKNLRHDKLAFIQNSKTNKTCTRSLTVSEILLCSKFIFITFCYVFVTLYCNNFPYK